MTAMARWKCRGFGGVKALQPCMLADHEDSASCKTSRINFASNISQKPNGLMNPVQVFIVRQSSFRIALTFGCKGLQLTCYANLMRFKPQGRSSASIVLKSTCSFRNTVVMFLGLHTPYVKPSCVG